jgi:hypothetical protein
MIFRRSLAFFKDIVMPDHCEVECAYTTGAPSVAQSR